MISGPIRGLGKTAPDGADTHTHGHGDSMTESAQWGQFSENMKFARCLLGSKVWFIIGNDCPKVQK